MNGWVGRWVGGRVDGQMDGWVGHIRDIAILSLWSHSGFMDKRMCKKCDAGQTEDGIDGSDSRLITHGFFLSSSFYNK